MGKAFVFLEFKHSRCLALAHIDALINRFNKLVFPIYEVFALELGWHKPVCEEDGLFRTSLFTETTKDAAEHVDLIFCSVPLFPVQKLFAFFCVPPPSW